jgi:hypothetical protein
MHRCAHERRPLDSASIQLVQFVILRIRFCKIHFNLIFLCSYGVSSGLFPSSFIVNILDPSSFTTASTSGRPGPETGHPY